MRNARWEFEFEGLSWNHGWKVGADEGHGGRAEKKKGRFRERGRERVGGRASKRRIAKRIGWGEFVRLPAAVCGKEKTKGEKKGMRGAVTVTGALRADLEERRHRCRPTRLSVSVCLGAQAGRLALRSGEGCREKEGERGRERGRGGDGGGPECCFCRRRVCRSRCHRNTQYAVSRRRPVRIGWPLFFNKQSRPVACGSPQVPRLWHTNTHTVKPPCTA
jgi:hypothetical protein